MCYSRRHEENEASEVAVRRWVDGARSLLGPASPCARGQTCGGGRSYHCRGGSGRHVGSLLGGAFKPSRLAGGCRQLSEPSGTRAGSHFSRIGDFRLACSRSALFSQHLAPCGERCRSVSASILSISAETASRARLSAPALSE